jgi:hypothetical protein
LFDRSNFHNFLLFSFRCRNSRFFANGLGQITSPRGLRKNDRLPPWTPMRAEWVSSSPVLAARHPYGCGELANWHNPPVRRCLPMSSGELANSTGSIVYTSPTLSLSRSFSVRRRTGELAESANSFFAPDPHVSFGVF